MLASVVNGLITGAIYGLVAIGLVLVYKGVRVFNFAQGEFGTVGAFVAWLVSTGGLEQGQVPGVGRLLFAMLIGVLAATAFGLLLERLVIRPLGDAPRVILLVVTAGVAVGAISLQILMGEATARVLTSPVGYEPIFLFNVALFPQQVLVMVALAVTAAGLYLLFSRTNLGLAVLATSQDVMATRLSGISTKRISAFVWGLAALLGGVAGVLQAAVGSFTPGFMTTGVLLPAFTAAVLGGMTSLPGAFVGGLLVGVAQDVGGRYIPASIPGGAELTVFTLLLLVLLVRPQGLLGKAA